ncbi:MAG: hypothetical protein NZ842_09505, partial [Dehalococcoidia bacterium]|nr:hypothetical protein [Dehalococcoidia bacterium]
MKQSQALEVFQQGIHYSHCRKRHHWRIQIGIRGKTFVFSLFLLLAHKFKRYEIIPNEFQHRGKKGKKDQAFQLL